jgi:predicted AAA+ superfamily ATPase
MITRQIGKKALALAKKYPALVVTGPRQSGKTTLVKQLFDSHAYFSLENPDTRLFAEEDPRGFLASAGNKIILDEVQQVPQLFSYLQEVLDNRTKNGQVILSGSQSFLLNDRISQSLAGRVAGIKLLPLSYQELKTAGVARPSLSKFLFKGCYPRLYKEKIAPTDFYPYYIETYLQRDVRQLRNVGNLNTFMRFLKLCAGRIGNILNISSLANDANISVNTVKLWLSLLEASYILFFVQPYFKNVNRRLVKMPKLYFYDTGLACSLLDIENERQIENFYLQGNLFENMVFSELVKNRFNQGLQTPFYFLRDSKGNEIDCVVEKTTTEIFMEIKMSATCSTNHLKGINSFQQTQDTTRKSYVIYTGQKELRYNNVQFINWENIDQIKL